MTKIITALALAAASSVAVAQPAANAPAIPHTVHNELTLYQMTGYNGDDWVVEESQSTVHTDWNIRSILVHPGDRWQICARTRFRDPCIILSRSVPDASQIGIEGQIGSARPAPAATAPTPASAPQGN
jgi:hypothetical protein